jgi:hypothetical protein
LYRSNTPPAFQQETERRDQISNELLRVDPLAGRAKSLQFVERFAELAGGPAIIRILEMMEANGRLD